MLNSFIDISLIESAKIIREEYLSLMESLNRYEVSIKELSGVFLQTASELELYNKGEISKQTDVESVSKFIVDKLDHLQSESDRIYGKISPINLRIEKLKLEETELYELLIKKYPSKTEEEIIQEIQNNI